MTAGGIEVPAAQPAAAPGGRRPALVSALLLLPAGFWYLVLLVIPLALVVVVSFGVRAPDGGYAPAFTFDNYAIVLNRTEPFVTSLEIAAAGTILGLLVAFLLHTLLSTRARHGKG